MSTTRDPRIARAEDLIQRAWSVREDLEQLCRELPREEVARTATPSDKERAAFVKAADIVRVHLSSGLDMAVMGHTDFSIQSRLLPPSRKRGEETPPRGDEWFQRRDEDLGPEPER